VRRLIINADDFGLTRGVNRGIMECWRDGVVTSTTLMANGAAFEDALGAVCALSCDGERQVLGVGCHVVLLDGEPLLAGQVPSLLEDGTCRFNRSLGPFLRALVTGRLSAEEIEAEASAQFRKIQSGGISVSHFDTHKHVHLFPAVLKPLLRAARACGIRAMRNPFVPVKPLACAHLLRRPRLWKRYAEVKALRGWAQAFRRAAEEQQIATTDGTFGIVVTGALDKKLFRAIAGSVPEGTWELCCHPGYHDSDLDRIPTRLRQSRDREREALTSAAARQALAEHGIELISYQQLV
jgi:predicted glycoside hydrolase/deacetylase ChbG (UPF0249 family)